MDVLSESMKAMAEAMAESVAPLGPASGAVGLGLAV